MKKDFINNTTMEESKDREEEKQAAELRREEFIADRNTSIVEFLSATLNPKHPSVIWVLEVNKAHEIILKSKILDCQGVSTAKSLAKEKVKDMSKDIANTLGISTTDFSSQLRYRPDRTDQGEGCIRFRMEFDKRLTNQVWRHLGEPGHNEIVRTAMLIGLRLASNKSLLTEQIPIELWATFCALACGPYMLGYDQAEILASKVLESTCKQLKLSPPPKRSPAQTHRTLTQNQNPKSKVSESTFKQSKVSLLPPPRPSRQAQDHKPEAFKEPSYSGGYWCCIS